MLLLQHFKIKMLLDMTMLQKFGKNNNGLTVAETDIANIKSGLQVVKKAEQDKNGNDIVETYATKTETQESFALKANTTYVDSQDQALQSQIEGNDNDILSLQSTKVPKTTNYYRFRLTR